MTSLFLDVPSPPPTRRGGTLAVLLGCCALLLAAGCSRSPNGGDQDEGPVFDQFARDALADYLPEKTASVVTIRLRALLDAPVVRERLQAQMKEILRHGEAKVPWTAHLGVDPFKDVDEIRVALCDGDPASPMWLLRGRFRADRLPVGPGQLQKKKLERYRAYEYRAADGTVTTLALAGDTLVACNVRPRVAAALNRAAGEHRPVKQAPEVEALLEKVDRKQTVWLATAFDKLGGVGPLQSRALEIVLHPVFTHAQRVQGGLTFAGDVRADFVLYAADDANARELEQSLKSVGIVAQGVEFLPLGLDKDLMPLVKLAGSGQVSRDGKTLQFHGRLPADQIGQ